MLGFNREPRRHLVDAKTKLVHNCPCKEKSLQRVVVVAEEDNLLVGPVRQHAEVQAIPLTPSIRVVSSLITWDHRTREEK
jgi:hypothetical protein